MRTWKDAAAADMASVLEILTRGDAVRVAAENTFYPPNRGWGIWNPAFDPPPVLPLISSR
jgi:hypothetical protein